MTQDMFLEAQQRSEIVPFEPTQRAALDRFKKFASDMGAHDAGQRDFDFVACNSSAASALSPRLKQRLITEEVKWSYLLGQVCGLAKMHLVCSCRFSCLHVAQVCDVWCFWCSLIKGGVRALRVVELIQLSMIRFAWKPSVI
jgi:hypothetical protein